MYVTYGSYRHDDNTVTLSAYHVRSQYSPRHAKYCTSYEVHLHGQLIVNDPSLTTPAQLQAAQAEKISALINAYSENDKDFSFFHDDGTKTRHSLTTGNALNGVQVKARSWPKGDEAEYATLRTFYIVLEATYDDVEAELMTYSEQFHYIGTGGPKYSVTETYNGPVYELEATRTAQRMIQTGHAVGWSGYPLVHINPFFPQWEHLDRREVVVHHPMRYRNAFRQYAVNWKFDHTLPSPINGVPIPR